jgi:hypothetical protein
MSFPRRKILVPLPNSFTFFSLVVPPFEPVELVVKWIELPVIIFSVLCIRIPYRTLFANRTRWRVARRLRIIGFATGARWT